jgi:hypothetical protein
MSKKREREQGRAGGCGGGFPGAKAPGAVNT